EEKDRGEKRIGGVAARPDIALIAPGEGFASRELALDRHQLAEIGGTPELCRMCFEPFDETSPVGERVEGGVRRSVVAGEEAARHRSLGGWVACSGPRPRKGRAERDSQSSATTSTTEPDAGDWVRRPYKFDRV